MNMPIIRVLFLAFVLGASVHQAKGQTSYEILSQLGFSLSNDEAKDFSLPLIMEGTQKKLSDYKGKWIWLAFWATWCGPCVYEMPHLQALNDQLKGTSFTMLGVNVDRGKTPQELKHFLQSKNISFPNFQDENSTAASAYESNSLPTLYVISPDFKVVAVFQGANDWSQKGVVDLVKQLIESKEMGDAQVASKDKVSKIPPPVLTLVADELNPKMVQIKVAWQGSAYLYQIKVPELTLPAGVKHGDIQTESYAQGNDSVLLYKYPLEFTTGGNFEIGPGEAQFIVADKPDHPQYARTTTVKIFIPTPIYKQRFFYPAILFIVVIMGISRFLFKKAARRRKSEDTILQDLRNKKDKKDHLHTQFKNLLTLEYQGKHREFVVGILQLEEELEIFLNTWDNQKNKKKEEIISQIKYANIYPQQTELDSKKNRLANYFNKESTDDDI